MYIAASAFSSSDVVPALDSLDDQRELVSADSAHEVRRADGVLKPQRDVAEHLVTRAMPVLVVDELEIVQINEEERPARAVPSRALPALDEKSELLHATAAAAHRAW